MNPINTHFKTFFFALLIPSISFANYNNHPNWKTYPADLPYGIVGNSEAGMDDPGDNVFKVYLETPLNGDEEVILTYDLKGVSSHIGLARSINGQYSIGGYLVKRNDKWTRQEEKINPASLKKGENIIQFSISKNAKYHYEIKSLSLKVSSNATSIYRNKLEINQPDFVYYGNQSYIKGFTTKGAKIFIDNKEVAAINGEFESIVNKQNFISDWEVVVKAEFLNGEVITKIVDFCVDGGKLDVQLHSGEKKSIITKKFYFDQTEKFESEGFYLESDCVAYCEELTLQIIPLRQIDVPTIGLDIINVTAGPVSYRVNPVNIQFEEPVQVGLKYDIKKIPNGYTTEDIKTFIFDHHIKKWMALEKYKIDEEKNMIISNSMQTGDMINGIIQVPESPESAALTPTTMKDIQAATASAGINSVQLPMVNPMGTANLFYPILIPPGRQGMQPQLALSYNSEGGSSWCGNDWDLVIPAVTIDTRWGVPRYHNGLETETYTLNGQQLDPVAHRGTAYLPRENEKRFYPRVNTEFNKIIRHGNNPKTYWWEVTDKNGTRNFYGGDPINGVDPKAVLKDDDGNIGYWALKEVRSLHNNFVRYHYVTVKDYGTASIRQINTPNIQDGVFGYQLYFDSITYTGHQQQEGPYCVKFTRDGQGEGQIARQNADRPDINIDARLGFKRVTADLLEKIEVKFNGTNIRSYELKYNIRAFPKTFLDTIIEKDRNGEEFTRHSFDYYNEVLNDTGDFSPMEDVQQSWEMTGDPVNGNLITPVANFDANVTALSGIRSVNQTKGYANTAGPPSDPSTKSGTTGGNYAYNLSISKGVLTSIDLDGDSKPDKVYVNENGKVEYKKNLSGPGGLEKFADVGVEIIGLENIYQDKSITNTLGFEFNGGASTNVGFSQTTSTTTIYFADVNGDGLVDLVKNGHVLYNHIDITTQHPVFTNSSSDTPSPIIETGSLDPTILNQDSLAQVIEEANANNPLHDVVKVWQAPFDGEVSINSDIRLIQYNTPERQNYETADGVIVSIQKDTMVLFRDSIAGDTSNSLSVSDTIFVNKGNRFYFRVQSREDGNFDQVIWNPVITYIHPDHGINTRDANGNRIYQFNSKEDFLTSGHAEMVMPISGIVEVSGIFSKPALSDTIKLEVFKNNDITPIWSNTFNTATIIIDLNIVITAINSVVSGDKFRFRVSSNTNVDWGAISWKPVITYTSSSDPNNPLPANGVPIFQIFPIVEYTVFPNMEQISLPWVTQSSVVPATVRPRIILTNDLPSDMNGEITFTIKQNSALRHEQTIKIINGDFQDDWDDFMVNPVISSQPYYFDFHTNIPDLYDAINTANVRVEDINGSYQPAGFYTVWPGGQEELFGNLYRYWGQFAYNGNLPYRDEPIDEFVLHADNSDDIDTVTTTRFYIMWPSTYENRWYGGEDQAYVAKDTISSSRLGEDDLSFFNPFAGGLDRRAIDKISKSRTGFAYASASIAGLNAGAGWSEVVTDFIDMNGDGFPDNVGDNKIHYTVGQGALSTIDASPSFRGVQYSTSDNYTLSGGGVVAPFNTALSNGGNKNIKSKIGQEADGRAAGGVSANASASFSTDAITQSLIDMNGDGLPDIVTSDGKVRLNLGYRFSDVAEKWVFPMMSQIREDETIGLSAGLGVNIVNNSIAAGVGLGKNNNITWKSFIDMNGDGLPDLVSLDPGGNLSVYINNGNGFSADPINWSVVTGINEGSSTSESVNGAFTICFVNPTSKICINPSGSIGQNINKQTVNIQDINGDGYSDFLQSENTGDLSVRSSKIGKTNKLKQVFLPLGANFSIDYKRVGNTYEMPNSVWAMSQVTLFDGFAGDGADTIRTAYVYENGYYDRHEREFYGFGTVISNRLNTENNNAVYSSTIQKFNNSNYYEKGLLESEVTEDASGKKFSSTSYSYELKDVITGNILPPSFSTSDDGAAFPAMTEMQTQYYEKFPDVQKVGKMTYQYDQYGNINTYTEFGDIDENGADVNPNDNYSTVIAYHDYPATYIVGSPSSVIVSAGGTTYRRRETQINGTNGNLLQVSKFLEDGTAAVFEMTYDQYGNLESVTRPENHNGARLSFTYEYDPEVQTYVTHISDSYGYSSEAEYDFRYGQMTLSKDINNQEVHTILDGKGRIEKIIGPYELADSTAEYTIRFEYHPEGAVPWALTQHYDEQHPDNPIETVTFIDGLARPIQVKKDVAMFSGVDQPDQEARVVSGRAIFDSYGRITSQKYPVLEDLSIDKGVFNYSEDNINPTITHYDELDRVLEVILPDASITKTQYTIGPDRLDHTMLLTKVTDAEGNIKDYFTNVRGLSTSTKEYIADAGYGEVWTSYTYNPINEIAAIIDDQDNSINYEYDWFGRTTIYNHPDRGITRFTYDPADNLIQKTTANLTGAGTNGADLAIQYTYDHERLTRIIYPLNPKNNVTYAYGAPGATDNLAGRIAFQLDATGKQDFYYGPQGELVKAVRFIIVIEGRPPRMYTTRWRYDSWNRLQQMIYPDGEVLNYTYNEGGNLHSFSGTKLGVDYPYLLQSGYDKFEQRVYMKYGNGTETTYGYEPNRRRLQNMLAKTTAGRPMMNNLYAYDRVSNVLSITNSAPIPQIWELGGPSSTTFTYDDLYRLKTAQGTWQSQLQTQRFGLQMTYNSLHDITNKSQIHQRKFYNQNNWQTSNFTSYNNPYNYESAQPHAATHIGNRSYEYDDNGNLSSRVDDNFFGQQRHLDWDEKDRLMQLDDDERLHNYIYDADDNRVIKQKDAGQTIWINGVPVGGNNSNNYTIFVNPFLVVNGGGFTKHYFIEGQRICSKLGLGPYGLSSTWDDYNYWDYWGDWNDFYAWGNFDNFGNNDAWDNWASVNEGSNWDNWDPSSDGNFPGGDWINNKEFFWYFYHPDHVGSSNYVTDQYGEVHQHFEYFPFGESFVYEHKNTDQSPYRFSGKFLDAETGLYDYGARYYDPQESRWLSVDPMAEKYAGWSPYNYTLLNPMRYVDPDGKEPSFSNRLWGGVQVLGGILEGAAAGGLMLAPDPTMATKVGGIYLGLRASDNLQAGIRQVLSGERTNTALNEAIQLATGASQETADKVELGLNVGELAIGVIGGLSKAAQTVKKVEAFADVPKAARSSNIGRTIHSGKQGKHIVGHNNYQSGKSILKSDAQSLLDDFHAGNIKSSRVISESKTSVDFGKTIGDYVKDGVSTPTSVGTVINSKTGVHIVPANPIQY